MTCDKPAVALLTFSPPDAKAWLYDLDQPDPTGGIMLCRKHANATVVPMSWQLVDSRDPAWPGPVDPDRTPAEHGVSAMAAASAHEVVTSAANPARDLPSDSGSVDEFAGLEQDLPITPQRYAEPALATARAAGRSGSSEVFVDNRAPAPDQSLFELPLSDFDLPAVTPHPNY